MISKSSLLAVNALTILAGLPPQECLGAEAIAKQIDAPANYLGKILRSLTAYDLVYSRKGQGGGFRLKRSPRLITVYDVVQSLEDTEKWQKCFLGRRQCLDSSPCSVHDRWKKLRQANVDFLRNITLAELSERR